MKENFLQYIADSGKFGSEPNNLAFTETFSIFTSELPEIEKLKKEYDPHVTLTEIVQYYFEKPLEHSPFRWRKRGVT